MAEVSGTIGNEYVELNNAATEATLKLLLAATMSANKQSLDSVKSMATKMGLDPAAVKAANDGLKQTGDINKQNNSIFYKAGVAGGNLAGAFGRADAMLGPLIAKLNQGTAEASDLFGTFTKLGGPVGFVADMFSRLARFQEENLRTYQTITTAGVNFGGSLTDMRMAAQNSFMSLQEFSGFIKRNGESFARMGGSADQGAKSFLNLSNALLKGNVGDNLRALGYTTEQINDTMANYIASSGGRTRQEMQNTAALTAATNAYMTELDALTQFTGVSKEKLAEEAKKAAQNEAFQRKLSTMDEAERAKLKAAYDKAAASGIAGATDLVMSAALGLPPVTKAAQTLSGVAPAAANGFTNMTKTAMDTTKSMKDVNHEYSNTLVAAKDASKSFGQTGDAVATMGGEYGSVMNGLIGAENKMRTQGIENARDADKVQSEIAENQKKQQESQAKAAVETQKAMQLLGQSVMASLLPVINLLTPAMNFLVKGVGLVAEQFNKLPDLLKTIIAGGLAYLAFRKIKEAKEMAAGMKNLGTAANPMHVTGGGPGGGIDLPDKGGKGGKGGKLGKFGGMAKGLGLGMAGGIAGDLAADALGRDTTAGKTADTLGTAASWAGMGAMLGPWGALAGGVAGAGYGAYKNFFGDKPKMAEGGLITQPTNVLAGESGPEIIAPTKHFENLRTELETLNKQTADMIRYLRDTAESSRRNVDAIKALNGDNFKF